MVTTAGMRKILR